MRPGCGGKKRFPRNKTNSAEKGSLLTQWIVGQGKGGQFTILVTVIPRGEKKKALLEGEGKKYHENQKKNSTREQQVRGVGGEISGQAMPNPGKGKRRPEWHLQKTDRAKDDLQKKEKREVFQCLRSWWGGEKAIGPESKKVGEIEKNPGGFFGKKTSKETGHGHLKGVQEKRGKEVFECFIETGRTATESDFNRGKKPDGRSY